mmetsp:Transcript_34361/g.108282  ORF Transcript_34361/g.108282 Transcript_34361/m.108282 type:complete len:228 (-) Transcript_34361:983-1666(-)
MRFASAFSMFRILPRSGSTACVRRSRPCLAEPAALSPSTMKSSVSSVFRLEQSASLPGSTVEVSSDLRRTISRAALAAAAAACAAWALARIASRNLGWKSKVFSSSSASTVSTATRASRLPRRFLVWPSNSGSGTFTDTMAVRPSRMKSRAMEPSSFLILFAFLPALLTSRVTAPLTPSRCVPPSPVRIPLAKPMQMSLYCSLDQRSATSTSMPSTVPRAVTIGTFS